MTRGLLARVPRDRRKATKADGPAVLLAEYDAEKRKGGTGGRGGAHPVRISELPIKFLPNRLFAPAPIKRTADGGEAMKGTWVAEKGSRQTGVSMKVDAQGHK